MIEVEFRTLETRPVGFAVSAPEDTYFCANDRCLADESRSKRYTSCTDDLAEGARSHYVIDLALSRWHDFYAMDHFLAIGIHHVFRCRSTYLERSANFALRSKSFVLNKDRESSLLSADSFDQQTNESKIHNPCQN